MRSRVRAQICQAAYSVTDMECAGGLTVDPVLLVKAAKAHTPRGGAGHQGRVNQEPPERRLSHLQSNTGPCPSRKPAHLTFTV